MGQVSLSPPSFVTYRCGPLGVSTGTRRRSEQRGLHDPPSGNCQVESVRSEVKRPSPFRIRVKVENAPSHVVSRPGHDHRLIQRDTEKVGNLDMRSVLRSVEEPTSSIYDWRLQPW